MPDYDTLLYEERDGVAWVTLNRPEVHNAFNHQMQAELKDLWRSLRHHDAVRCVVLTGSGEKAFCTGIDREEAMGAWEAPDDIGTTSAIPGGGSSETPFHFDDPGENIGPKTNDLWKPVIAAVNGMACGGAFYMLGEVEFIIASEHATFFDPHTTFGMTACFESMHMLQKMPFHEIMRLALLGSSERMSAERAPRDRSRLRGGPARPAPRRRGVGRHDDRPRARDRRPGDRSIPLDGQRPQPARGPRHGQAADPRRVGSQVAVRGPTGVRLGQARAAASALTR